MSKDMCRYPSVSKTALETTCPNMRKLFGPHWSGTATKQSAFFATISRKRLKNLCQRSSDAIWLPRVSSKKHEGCVCGALTRPKRLPYPPCSSRLPTFRWARRCTATMATGRYRKDLSLSSSTRDCGQRFIYRVRAQVDAGDAENFQARRMLLVICLRVLYGVE